MTTQRPLPPRLAAVTFDCWNTLLHEEMWEVAHVLRVAALERAVREAGRRAEREAAGAAFDVAWKRHMDLWEEGRVSGAPEVARWALQELGIEPDGIPLADLIQDFERASHTSRVLALEGAGATLAALRERGVRMGLICDTGLTPGREVRRHLERLGLLEFLEVQIFSDEVGVPKPHEAAFRAALGPLGVDPSEALHVGDLRRTDVAGARAVGMATVRIRELHDDETELPEADAVADSHAHLRELIGL